MLRTGIFSINQLKHNLTSSDEIIILSTLEELESIQPNNQIKLLLEELYKNSLDPIIKFQIKKTLNVITIKLLNKPISIIADHIENMIINKSSSLEALATAISLLEPTEAIIAIDILRYHNWHTFPDPILPTFCRFIKKYGSQRDAQQLIELTRSINPIIMLVALDTLEIIEPLSLPEIIKPLLSSNIPKIKGQAIKALYRYSPADSIKELKEMLFSENSEYIEVALFYCSQINYNEIEGIILDFITKCNNPKFLGKVTQILQNNAYLGLPEKLYSISQNLEVNHKNLIIGMLLGVIRALANKNLINCSFQEYLDKLKSITDNKNKIKDNKQSLRIDIISDKNKIHASNSELDIGFTLPDLNIITQEATKDLIKEYESLNLSGRIRFLRKLDFEGYKTFRSILPQLVRKTKDKELAALIKLIGRFGKHDDSGIIREFIHSSNPSEACAAIEALSKIDPDYLIVYLPQLIQSKIGKVRLVAARIFSKIDHTQAISLVKSLLLSSSIKQRLLGISIAILMDFSVIKNILLLTFYRETNIELINKLGLILSSNPDFEVMIFTYDAYINSSNVTKEHKYKVLELIIEKFLSISIEKKSKEKILEDIIKYYNSNKTKFESLRLQLENSNSLISQVILSQGTNDNSQQETTPQIRTTPDDTNIQNTISYKTESPAISDKRTLSTTPKAYSSNSSFRMLLNKATNFFTSTDYETKSLRAKIALIIWIIVVILWGFMIAIIGTEYLFGGS